jgi:hypothetical protein
LLRAWGGVRVRLWETSLHARYGWFDEVSSGDSDGAGLGERCSRPSGIVMREHCGKNRNQKKANMQQIHRPKFKNVLMLRCLYCGGVSLRQPKSWLSFAQGCQKCNYLFEREEGYFAGSSWMINYTVIAVIGILFAVFLITNYSLGSMTVASLVSAFLVVFGLFFFPYGQALWMYFDHLIHPLSAKDAYKEST